MILRLKLLFFILFLLIKVNVYYARKKTKQTKRNNKINKQY